MEELKGEGQILFSAYRRVDAGRFSKLQKKEILLDLIAPEDEEILQQKGVTALRQTRIARLSSRAAEQGAILTYDDLVHLLSTSLSTVKRDVRALQQGGFPVPLYRRRGRRVGGLVLPILLAILFSSRAQAQLSSIFGNVGFDYDYENQQNERTSTSRQHFSQQYSLGVDGRILDPRLATFFLSGAFNSTFLGQQDTRGTSFSGSLSLLQGAPYGLTLRGGRSLSFGGTDAESGTIGANLRITLRDWPQLFLDFDRSTVESQGGSRSDFSITTGRARLFHRFWSTVLDGEIGVQTFADEVRGTSQDRYFARLNNTVTWSPTTTLRSVNDAFLQGNQLVMGSSYSVENRPDPTLNRTATFSYRSSKAEEEQNHALSLSGALSKTFFPYPWLQANAFTSAVAQKSFGTEDPAGFAWSGGSSSVINYYQPVSLLADYALAVSYQTEAGQPSTTQQVHVGAISRTLQPLNLGGDYYFAVQTGSAQGTRHFVVGRADWALTPGLSLRAVADFLSESLRSSGPQGFSSDRTATNFGGGATYRPFYNLTLDLAGNLQWNVSRETSDTTLRAKLRVAYVLPKPFLLLDIDGTWEQLTANEQNRFEVRSRLTYPLGQATLSLEHRLERRETFGSAGLTNSIRLSLVRPFRIGF